MKRTLLLWIGAPLVMLVGLGVILDLYCELVGLPDIGRRACQQWLEGRGIACDTKHIRMGVIGGVTVDNLTLWDRTRPGKRVLVADHVRWRPDLSALLTGTLRHGRLIVENGTLYVPVPRKEGTGTAGERQELTLSEVSLEAEITSHVLTLDVSASLEGIQLQFAGQLSGFGKARQAETDGRKPHPLGWQPALDRLPEKGGAALRWIRRFTSTYLLVEDDAFVNATFNIDLQHPGSNYVAGKLQLADMVLRNVPIRKCKAQFQLDAHRLALDRATVYLGVGSKVAGSVRMNIAERVLAATAAGTLDPHLLYRFLGRPMPRFLAEATFPTPPVITAELEPSPLAPEEWKWQCDFEVENSVYRREFIRHAEGTLRRTPGSLVADGLQVRFDAAGREVVTGRVQ
ncbi:MAG: hypothetical protein K9N51_01360, partial [Candidatus Pacebacteria bacterium]|nr:hypothetical protein [Candidatus Paceibacterota bacterium]